MSNNKNIVINTPTFNKCILKGRVMRLSIKGFNLLTRILEMVLYITLQRLMGLKCDTSLGKGHLGIRVGNV